MTPEQKAAVLLGALIELQDLGLIVLREREDGEIVVALRDEVQMRGLMDRAAAAGYLDATEGWA